MGSERTTTTLRTDMSQAGVESRCVSLACRGPREPLNLNSQAQVAAPGVPVRDEVDIARESLASLNPGDNDHLSKLDALASALMSRFSLSGLPDDLDEAIALGKQMLELAPPGHASHSPVLSNMGQTLSRRFKLRGDDNDLEQAVGYFEAAVAACTPEQSFYLPFVSNLSSGLLNRYRRYGDVADLDRIIEQSAFALSTCPADSPNRDSLLNNWATALKERFEKKGNRNDLDEALTRYHSCLELRPPGHPLRFTVLGNLADATCFRFEVDGRLQDLESAANFYGSALQLRSPGQDGFLICLTGLGVVFVHLFHVQGDIQKLQMAIDCYQTAMVHSTVPNLDHSRLLDNYGGALRARYILFGNVDDLNQAIQYLITSSDITPPTYSGWPTTLFILGVALLSRFDATSNIADLDSSIDKITSALELCGPNSHQRPAMLALYGCALSARFKAKGDMQDLDLAVSTCKGAVALASPKDLNHGSTVANLSLALYECFYYKSGTIEEIQAIIEHCDRALASTLPAEPATITLKIVRAKAFTQKTLYGLEESDIRASVDAFREIIAMLPEGHAEQVPVHWELGFALQTRFHFSADIRDLDEAIAFCRIAHRKCQRGNTNYVNACMQLGDALRQCFEFDHGDTLDEAIVLLAEAEDISSVTPESPNYRASLVNLSNAIFMRFQAQKNSGDLDTAVEHLSRALALPASVQEFSIPFTLGTILLARYCEHADLDDLERSIKLFGIAVEQMPPKYLYRAALCRHYGHALFKLGSHRDQPQHLNAAIALYEEALTLLPVTHYDQPLTVIRLVEALYIRAKLLSDIKGLFYANDIIRDLLRKLPQDSPMFRQVCYAAATMSITMYALSDLRLSSFMEDGFRFYEQAASYTHFHSFTSVGAALDWVDYAEKLDHMSALLAYRTCFDSLNQHLLSTASIKSRRDALLNKHWIKQTGTLATDAMACAITQGDLELAVELSEQGRGLLWSQMAQSHTPLDALRSTSGEGRALASDFERVSARLTHAVTQSDMFLSASRLATEEAARRYRQLSKELQDIVARIRRLDGFESFLQRASFQSLQRAALGGPVIIVNISRRRCDALIVLHDAPPRLVPLPNTTLSELTTLSADLYDMLKRMSRVGEEKMRERELVVFLRTLWDVVVRPIVDELTGFLPRGARIWWCPTSKLTSLPLHAAGPHRQGSLNLANMYVSSYTPTLAALIRARHRHSESPRTSPAFVAIGQAKPSSSTSPELHTVGAELTLVQSLVPPAMPFSALAGDASTADAALAALRTHAWAHLACHGRPNVDQPFDASFALRDRALTVLDVVGTTRDVNDASDTSDVGDVSQVPAATTATTPDLDFAFLSACHTTVGDRQAPDEVIHLAAAMQFAGFRSVVGTMWAVDDAMAMAMVKAFYTCLFAPAPVGGPRGGGKETREEDKGWDCTMAARALNRAAKSVDKTLVSLDQRIVFIHIGA